jgi:hypothetical protein
MKLAIPARQISFFDSGIAQNIQSIFSRLPGSHHEADK